MSLRVIVRGKPKLLSNAGEGKPSANSATYLGPGWPVRLTACTGPAGPFPLEIRMPFTGCAGEPGLLLWTNQIA